MIFKCIFLAILIPSGKCFAQAAKDVFLITIEGCKFQPYRRHQTGFRINGTAGIITALHGIPDCDYRRITAQNHVAHSAIETYTLLSPSLVNIESDLVVLSSPEIEKKSKGGFVVASKSIFQSIGNRELSTIGYPTQSTVPVPTREIFFRDPRLPLFILRDYSGRSMLRYLENRGSPSPNIEILGIQGELQSGHSGAPILIANSDTVIGIVNGGKTDGSDEFVWAIPIFAGARWYASHSVQSDLARLKDIEPQNLFMEKADPFPNRLFIEGIQRQNPISTVEPIPNYFDNGDNLEFKFRTPIPGYLTVFVLDEESTPNLTISNQKAQSSRPIWPVQWDKVGQYQGNSLISFPPGGGQMVMEAILEKEEHLLIITISSRPWEEKEAVGIDQISSWLKSFDLGEVAVKVQPFILKK